MGTTLRFVLTGQAADCNEALTLLAGFKADAILADKSDDADDIIDAVQGMGSTVVISPQSHRKLPRTYDQELYKERHIVERMCNKLKHSVEAPRTMTHAPHVSWYGSTSPPSRSGLNECSQNLGRPWAVGRVKKYHCLLDSQKQALTEKTAVGAIP